MVSVPAALEWARSKQGGESGVRGEFCLVLGPVPQQRKQNAENIEAFVLNELQKLRGDGLQRSEAVKLVVQMLAVERTSLVGISKEKMSKSYVYKLALGISDWAKQR